MKRIGLAMAGMAAGIGMLVSLVYAEEKGTPLKIGDKAPDFVIGGTADKPLRLSDLVGKKNALIAFYPKAYTPVCTSEMCGFRDDFSRFRDVDTEVVAVSLDKQAKSDQFKHDKELPFNVLGDPEGKIVRAFGVSIIHVPIVGKAAKRSVFLVDKRGVIRYVDADYSIKSGKDGLYKAMEALKGKAVS